MWLVLLYKHRGQKAKGVAAALNPRATTGREVGFAQMSWEKSWSNYSVLFDP